ncbi:MAG TPA: pentapeptide repeat-containing protein, partial [Gemmatimonadaceae bacterium]|nr:pentapeptide repeat-containing protein [Gemmatimonadaceae bacterium]
VLTGANLDGAVLVGADLTLANLSGVRVTGADFGDTLWSKTTLARVTGLQSARGLERLRYGDPSSIDVHTLRTAISVLSAELLENCGLSPADVTALRAVLA